jgi:hypothetical protein
MSNDLIKQWIVDAAPRRISPDSIVLRYQATPPILSITLLAYQCCFPAINVQKSIESITQADIVEAVIPVFEHQH